MYGKLQKSKRNMSIKPTSAHPLQSDLHLMVNTPGQENGKDGWMLLYRSKVEEALSILAEELSRISGNLDKIHVRMIMVAALRGSLSAVGNLNAIFMRIPYKVTVAYDGDGLLGKYATNLDEIPPASKGMLYISLALDDLRRCGVVIDWCVHEVQFNEWSIPIAKYRELEGLSITDIDGNTRIIPEGFFENRIYHTSYFKRGDPIFSDPSYNRETHNYLVPNHNVECDNGAWNKKYGGYCFEKGEALGSAAAHINVHKTLKQCMPPGRIFSIMAYDEKLTGKPWGEALVGSTTEDCIKLGYFGDVILRYADSSHEGDEDSWATTRYKLMDTNSDGIIDLGEFIAAGGNRKLFNSLDADGSGYLDESELADIQLSSVQFTEIPLGSVHRAAVEISQSPEEDEVTSKNL